MAGKHQAKQQGYKKCIFHLNSIEKRRGSNISFETTPRHKHPMALPVQQYDFSGCFPSQPVPHQDKGGPEVGVGVWGFGIGDKRWGVGVLLGFVEDNLKIPNAGWLLSGFYLPVQQGKLCLAQGLAFGDLPVVAQFVKLAHQLGG
jgi:hypothetical protein